MIYYNSSRVGLFNSVSNENISHNLQNKETFVFSQIILID